MFLRVNELSMSAGVDRSSGRLPQFNAYMSPQINKRLFAIINRATLLVFHMRVLAVFWYPIAVYIYC
jgi:hypothetical protein